ncbi:MAG: hypothetical protein HGA53_00295 [Anaerolineaceae bacterium]|nr:hypothetical protein [Anaerolineaceae bacterium]
MANLKKEILSFAQVRLLILSFYEKGQYQAGLDAISKHFGHYPEQEVNISYWRLCLLSKLGKTREAVTFLQECITKGYWWSAENLKADDDLASLQTDPDFQKMLEICQTKQEEAQRIAQPKRFTLFPEHLSPNDTAPLLLCLHGRSSNATSFIEYWQQATQAGWIVAMLGSSQVIGYDTFCWDNKDLAEMEIRSHLRELNDQYSIDPNRIAIAGFSQGGGMAVRAAITSVIPAAGFLAIAPALVDFDILQAGLSSGVRVRGAVLAGDLDKRWADTARRITALMAEAGLPCETNVYPDLGHDFPPDFSDRLTAFLKAI